MNRYEHAMEDDEVDESGTWLSIGDLMSGLLMLFALLLMVTLTQLSELIEKNNEGRVLIIKALTDAMSAQGIDAEIDPVTGDVSIVDSVLFGLRESKLKSEGEAFLEHFVPVYAGVIFSDPAISEQITRIVIEGHTSSDGEYIYNMALSLDRAQSVLTYIDGLDFPERELFSTMLMPAGRGEIEADQNQPLPEDRKVLFRFQFKGDTERFVRLLGGTDA